MRHLLRSGSVGMLIAMLALGCVTPPPAGVPAPATVEVLPADARALRYGASAPAVFDNPEMRDKIRMMFGSDWTPAAQGGGRLQYGAAAYFPGDSRIRMLRMDGQDYIAISGCVATSCATHRGLVLIRADGDEMWARLDEGGFCPVLWPWPRDDGRARVARIHRQRVARRRAGRAERMSDGDKVLAWIRDWLADGGAILMIADYDGTLSPLVREPSQAWLEAGVRDHLRSLATCPRVRLTIISGRDLVDLRARGRARRHLCGVPWPRGRRAGHVVQSSRGGSAAGLPPDDRPRPQPADAVRRGDARRSQAIGPGHPLPRRPRRADARGGGRAGTRDPEERSPAEDLPRQQGDRDPAPGGMEQGPLRSVDSRSGSAPVRAAGHDRVHG